MATKNSKEAIEEILSQENIDAIKAIDDKWDKNRITTKSQKFATAVAIAMESDKKFNLTECGRIAGYKTPGRSVYVALKNVDIIKRINEEREIIQASKIDSKTLALGKMNKLLRETDDVEEVVKLSGELRKNQGWGSKEEGKGKLVPESVHFHLNPISTEETRKINESRNITNFFSEEGKEIGTNEDKEFEKEIVIGIGVKAEE